MSTTDRLAERYGRGPRRGGRMLLVYLLIVLVAVIAWFVWILWDALTPALGSQMQNYTAISENKVKITFQVNVYDEDAVPVCSAVARDVDAQKVGELSDYHARPGRQTITIKTLRHADKVEWLGCTDHGHGEAK